MSSLRVAITPPVARRPRKRLADGCCDAAAALFRDRGYDGASIVAIADAAGVAPETVYARFGNKRTLLGELVVRAVRGEEAAPVPEQAGPRAIAAERDQHRKLRMFAADIVLRLERAAPWSPWSRGRRDPSPILPTC